MGEIKHYKVLALPSNPLPNSVYYVLDKNLVVVRGYITDLNGIPIKFIDMSGGGGGSVVSVTGSGVTGTATNPVVNISSFISSQLGNLIYLSTEDGKLQVNQITSPNSSLTMTPAAGELQIQLSAAITNTINTAIQPGDNISDLNNDSNYITLAEIPPFVPADYDLEEFTNTSGNPFVRSSDIGPGETNLAYAPAAGQGTVTSDTGSDAIIPLEGGGNAGLAAPNTNALAASATQPGDNLSTLNNDSLYINEEQAQDAIGTILTDSTTVDFTYSDATPSITAIVKPNSISAIELAPGINNSEFVNDSNFINSLGGNTTDVTLTTIGSGPATLVGQLLNIPTPDFSAYLTSSNAATLYQPLDSDLSAIAALATTAFGRNLLTQATSAAVRAYIGAGTGNGDALTANPLSQFAATTSLQLLGIITDETGTDKLVFSDSPVLVNPTVGTQAPGNNTVLAASTAFIQTALASYLTTSAAAATYQPLDADLTAIAALTTTAFGRGLLTQATDAAVRAYIGAGTGNGDALTTNPLSQFAATSSLQLLGILTDETGTDKLVFSNSPTLVNPTVGTQTAGNNSLLAASTAFVQSALSAYLTTSTAASTYQPLDSDLTAIAALTTDSFGRGLLIQTSAANVRTYIGAGTGNGTVTTLSVTTANGVSGTVATATTTPAITLTLGAITPTSVTASGIISAQSFGANTTFNNFNISGWSLTASIPTMTRAVNNNVPVMTFNMNNIASGGVSIAEFQSQGTTVSKMLKDGRVNGTAGIAQTDFVTLSQIGVVGTSTQSGTGAATSFTIAHGLGTTPTYAHAVPKNAASANIMYQTWDATNITVFYSVAPASGTNNLNWAFTAR